MGHLLFVVKNVLSAVGVMQESLQRMVRQASSQGQLLAFIVLDSSRDSILDLQVRRALTCRLHGPPVRWIRLVCCLQHPSLMPYTLKDG